MLVTLPVLFLLLFTAGTQARKRRFIIGGQNTTIERFPSLVQVEHFEHDDAYWEQRCGGVILTSMWILSAAHCFGINAHDIRIRAGATNRDTNGSIHYVDFYRNHPDYNPDTNTDDISVVKLLTSLVYSPTIQKATIISQDYKIHDNLPVVQPGWGYKGMGLINDVLEAVDIFIVNRDICAQRYMELNTIITPKMICAGILDVGGKDACQGFSGGPLYAGDIVVGIVSFGFGCNLAYFPGVSTSVASYTNWILANAT